MTPFALRGIAHHLPRTIVPSSDLDTRLGREAGSVEREFGISERRIAQPDETSSVMAAAAARDALAQAGWDEGDFDVIIGGCGVMEQPIPSTAALVQRALGLGRSGIPSFDVNQTCLSALLALDIAAMGFATGRWKRALVFSSDIASAGLDDAHPKTAAIFGDGAAALCHEAGGDGGLLGGRFATHGDGADLATLRAGGTRLRVEEGYDALIEGSRFRMDPFAIFKAAARILPGVIDGALAAAGHDRSTIDLVICHQASAPGVEHVKRLFPDGERKVVDVFAIRGNQIAASIPSTLSHAVGAGLAPPGSDVLLLGTAAGISAGAMVLRL
jgi:3-oxoacyl-[acyl-carrier-protein] synthase-3